MTKKIDKPKLVLHFKSGNYIYRYVLVDRFKHDNKNHYGFDTKQELTEAEIFALVSILIFVYVIDPKFLQKNDVSVVKIRSSIGA